MPLLAEQSHLGRNLAIVRVYYMIGQKFNIPKIDKAMAAGTTVLASLDVPHSRGITYASIAAGRQDKEIRAWLTEAEQEAVAHDVPAVYVSFEHEANNPPNHVLGTPAQFQAAWRHIHGLAAKAHLNAGTGGRLRWAMILMHMAYFPASQRPKWSLRAGFASDYFPGAAYVNVIAADGYNRGGCRLHKTTAPTKPSVTPRLAVRPGARVRAHPRRAAGVHRRVGQRRLLRRPGLAGAFHRPDEGVRAGSPEHRRGDVLGRHGI